MTKLVPSDPFRRETMNLDIDYDALPSGEPYEWGGAVRGDSEWDVPDFHVDLGCGKLKKGRLGVDHFDAPGVDLVFDFEKMQYKDPNVQGRPYTVGGLPFPDSSIKSIITHHALEHVGEGFIHLMDEVYRVLEPGGLLRAITPLFPSHSAVADPDHCRYFLEGTWEAFCGDLENCWSESFSVPYTKARFEKVDQDITARSTNPYEWWTPNDHREIRVALIANK